MRLPLLATAVALSGCQALSSTDSFFGAITPYRIEIQQGNVITKEQLAWVAPGSTRVQVRDRLGTPLLTDPFHAERWDYVFTLRRGRQDPQRCYVVVWFQGDAVVRVEAPEDLPSEQEFVAAISSKRTTTTERKLELTDEERKALPRQAPAAEAPSEEPQGAARRYPPLESSS